MTVFRGGGGGGGKEPKRTADNLFSNDVVEAVLALGEGPIKGLVDGGKSFFVGETPLQNIDGENNFDEFELIINEGSDEGEELTSRLGGFASSTTVNTTMSYNVPITRQGQQTDIDFLDFRIVVNRLYRDDKKGTHEHTVRLRLEYKATSSPTWLPAFTAPRGSSDTPPWAGSIRDAFTTIFYGLNNKPTSAFAPGDRPTFWQDTPPNVVSSVRAPIWFKKNQQNRPAQQRTIGDNSVWADPPGLELKRAVDGTPDYWEWAATSDWGRDKKARAYVISTAPRNPDQGDYWLSPTRPNVMIYNGSSWIIAGSTQVTGQSAGMVSNGVLEIRGKTSAPYVREVRIAVPKINEAYQVRVTKLTRENTNEEFSDVAFESFQEVSAKPMRFPNTATCQLLARASDQFSNLPDFSGIYEGRVVKVPTNYDPEARTYTGVWDGNWKLAYTNNGAYIVNDLVENARYGMNAYYPVTLNKWDVYEAGQWCDEPVGPEGKPRFTFNALIADPRNGRDMINYICGSFGARFIDDGNGQARILLDKDQPATLTFMPENVVDGVFTYSFTDISTRYNDLSVTFINTDLNWQEDRRRVSDQPHIDRYNRIPFDFIAVGCNDVDEALRRGRYRLVTSITEDRIVNFKTNRQGLYIEPYSVILVCDEDMDEGLSGRIQQRVSTRRFRLRDPIHIEPGFEHFASFTFVNDAGEFQTSRHRIVGDGLMHDLVLSTNAPANLPEYATFTVECPETVGVPRAYRVMGISEDEDVNSDNITITAVIINRKKWDYVDNGGVAEPVERSGLDYRRVEQIGSLRVRPFIARVGNRLTSNLAVDWDESPSQSILRYNVYTSVNGGPSTFYSTTTLREMDLTDLAPGDYVISVAAVGLNDLESLPLSVEHRFIGDVRIVPPVENLRLTNGVSAAVFQDRGAKFEWDEPADPYIVEYQVRVIGTGTTTLRNFATVDPVFEYDHAKAIQDGLPRQFSIEVRAVDQFGEVSEPVLITVENPAPPAVLPEVMPGLRMFFLGYQPPDVPDFAGAKLWVSDTAGFDPLTTEPTYIGPDQNQSYNAEPGVPRYVRVAGYDTYSRDGLNISPEAVVTSADIIVDLEPPVVPTGLALSSDVLTGKLYASWDANAEEDFAFYEVELREVGGNWVGFTTSTNQYDWIVPPNIQVQVRLRARDTSGNVSGYSAAVDHTTARDTTPPARITTLRAQGGFELIWLSWPASPEADLAFYEIYESTSGSHPVTTAEPSFRSMSEQFVRQGLADEVRRFFWVRAVDTSGNRADWSVRADAINTVIDVELTTEKLQGLVDRTSLASSITVPSVVTGLPVPITNDTPKLVFNVADGQQYQQRADGSGWEAVVAGQVTNIEIADEAITSVKLAAAAVSASKIATGAILSEKLAENAVTLGKVARGIIGMRELSITDFENIIPNADFVAGLAGWAHAAGANVSTFVPYFGPDGRGVTITKATTGSVYIESARTSVQPGHRFLLTNRLRINSGAAGRIGFYAVEFDATGNQLRTRDVGMHPSDVVDFNERTREYVINSDVYAVAWRITHNAAVGTENSSVTISNISARRMMSAADVVDDAITTVKLANDAVSSAKVQAGAILEGKLADNAVAQNKLRDGAVSSAKIVDGAISEVKVATGAITNLKLGDLAVNAAKIASNAITEIKIAADAVSAAKIATGAVLSEKLANNAVTLSKVADGAIGTTKITDDAVTAEKILAGSIVAAKLAAGAVTANAIAAEAITAAAVQASAITTEKLAAGAVVAEKIAANAIVTSSIQSGAVTADKITALAVTADKIAANAVTAGSIQANAVIAAKIAASAITTDKLDALAVTTAKLAAGAVVADKIETGAVTTAKLAALAVDAEKIQAGAIISEKIAASAVIADKIATNAVTADKVAANAITANSIVTNAVTTAKIAAGAVTATELATNSVTAIKIQSSAVTADKIAAGSVTADKIAANVITARHLLLTDLANLALNGDFTQGLDGWSTTGAAALDTTRPLDAPTINVVGLGSTVNGSVRTPNSKFPTTGGETFAFELYAAKSEAATDGQLRVRIIFENINSNIGAVTPVQVQASAIPAGQWTKYEGVVTAPALIQGIATVRGYVIVERISAASNGQIYVTKVMLKRQNGATMIVDGAITTDKLSANSITAGKIAVGAVGADQIAANAITTSKLLIGDTTNILADSEMDEAALWFWDAAPGPDWTIQPAATDEHVRRVARAVLPNSSGSAGGFVASRNTPVSPIAPGKEYAFSGQYRTPAGTTGRIQAAAAFRDAAGGVISESTLFLEVVDGAGAVRSFNTIRTAPVGAVSVSLRFRISRDGNGSAGGEYRWFNLTIRPAVAGELIVDGAITAEKLTAGEVITASAQIRDAIITDAKVAQLSAAKLMAGTALANSLTIAGTSLGTIEGWANDPAQRINTRTTSILPGRIALQGGTTLDSWQKGGDLTKIDGGAISANTIDANKLTIGQRGITVDGIEFEANNPSPNRLTWTSGTITYVDDNGLVATTAVVSSTRGAIPADQTWYVYWVKGEGLLGYTPDVATAFASNAVVLASYRGGLDLTVDYGRTIIDGAQIKTGSITTERLAAGVITAEKIATETVTADALAANSVVASKIGVNAVTAEKIDVGAVTAEKLDVGAVTADKIRAGAVTSEKIVTGAITTDLITIGGVTTDRISDYAVSDGFGVTINDVSGSFFQNFELGTLGDSVEIGDYQTAVYWLNINGAVTSNAGMGNNGTRTVTMFLDLVAPDGLVIAELGHWSCSLRRYTENNPFRQVEVNTPVSAIQHRNLPVQRGAKFRVRIPSNDRNRSEWSVVLSTLALKR